MCITTNRLSHKDTQVLKGHTKGFFVTVKDRFAAVFAMLPCHVVGCQLVQVLWGLVLHCRLVFVWLPWSVVAWQQLPLRLGCVLAMLALDQALCQHSVVQMNCKTPDTSWS